MVGWIFFRSETIDDSFNYFCKLFLDFDFPGSKRQGLIYLIVFITWEILLRKDERIVLNFRSKILRQGTYVILLILVIIHSFGTKQSFIYFNF